MHTLVGRLTAFGFYVINTYLLAHLSFNIYFPVCSVWDGSSRPHPSNGASRFSFFREWKSNPLAYFEP